MANASLVLQSPTLRRERILIYGIEGTGKSYAWCMIAAWARRTGSPAQFYVMDSDVSAEAMADEFEGFYDNTHIFNTDTWGDYKEAAAQISKDSVSGRGDWVVLDTGDQPWNAIQNYVTDAAIPGEPEDWILDKLKAIQAAESKEEKKDAWAHVLSGDWGMNWHYVNSLYFKWWRPLVVRFDGHMLVTAHEKELVTKGDRVDKPLVAIYERYGVRPAGQKDLSLPMSTIIRATDNFTSRGHDWRMTTIKDRSRKGLVTEKVEDFAMDYLVGVARWKT